MNFAETQTNSLEHKNIALSKLHTLQEANISAFKGMFESMMFLFPFGGILVRILKGDGHTHQMSNGPHVNSVIRWDAQTEDHPFMHTNKIPNFCKINVNFWSDFALKLVAFILSFCSLKEIPKQHIKVRANNKNNDFPTYTTEKN